MKKVLVLVVAGAFLLPVLIAAAAFGSGVPLAVPTTAATSSIPPRFERLYMAAAARFGFPWQLLAAIGRVECDHGRADCRRPNAAGAMGPMQFMPATWATYRTSSGSPPYSVYDARDAIFAAAAKLADDGAARDPRAAIFAYNHSHSYVSEVLSWAARYGWGRSEDLASAVLHDPNIELRPEARSDILAGRVDPRVLGALLALSQRYRLGDVGPFITGHSTYVAGTERVSDHASGRAVDIPVVDGAAVSPSNGSARRAADLLLQLPPPLRPDELGSPWPWSSPVVTTFTRGHHDHIHIGYGVKP